MEISILKTAAYLDSEGVVDTTPAYSPKPRTFTQDEVIQSDGKIFQRTGGDFTPPPYDVDSEPDYALGDVVSKDGWIQYVDGLAGAVALAPRLYLPAPPSGTQSLKFGTWTHRYTNLGLIDPNTNRWDGETESGVKHSVYFDGTSWRYRILKQVVTSSSWTNEQYSYWGEPKFYIMWLETQGGVIQGYWDDVLCFSLTNSEPQIQVGDILTANTGIYEGIRFRVGELRLTFDFEEDKYVHTIEKEVTTTVDEVYDEVTSILSYSSLDVYEDTAVCKNEADCLNMWVAKTIIRDGQYLYARTNVDAVQEEVADSLTSFDILDRVDEINWGWTYISPVATRKPFDGKNYTFMEAAAPVEYLIRGDSLFNTLAITGVIAETIEVTFVPYSGDPIQTITITPANNRDIYNRLQPYQSTVIVYAPRDITGNVHVKLISDSNVRIGGFFLGLSTNAGFTNLTFGNKFKDYSPYEKDQFGNILYIDGVKTNIYSGTVDVPITNYDMVNRLMASIGGNTVILNGSDNKENNDTDSENFFSATMVVGRVRGFNLKTKLDNKLMSQMATYTFEIEEDI